LNNLNDCPFDSSAYVLDRMITADGDCNPFVYPPNKRLIVTQVSWAVNNALSTGQAHLEVLYNGQLYIPLTLDAYGTPNAPLGGTETYPSGVGFPNGATICVRSTNPAIHKFTMQGYFAK
jgi:hypothetical protein